MLSQMLPSERIKTFKKVLSAGRGKVPEFKTGTKVIFHYETLKPLVNVNKEGFPDSRDNYKSIDSTRKPYPDGYGKPLELVFGKKFQLPIFERCLETMLIDEISQFDIAACELYPYPSVSQKLRDISKDAMNPGSRNHHHAHCAAAKDFIMEYEDLNDLIKNPQPLRFIFHLLVVLQPEDYEPDSWQLEPDEKLASVAKLKESGNEYLQKGDFMNASQKYREALSRIDTLLLREKPGDPEWVDLDRQNIPLFLNLCLCYLNWKQYYEAIDAATEVLKRDKLNEKALYRRAKGRIAVWDLEKAEDDLKMLQQQYPSNANLVKIELERIQSLIKEREESAKNTYKHMFRNVY
ncbi:peptidyl-prolyl cis-trans isomerase, FKBP-type family protein [Brugia malayi]|nr:peptidyl-prolyl cis-trans isomerase, FKBP-type family protein [Brugia malayi]VIO94577.1 peptidyl-prolyl cis-trans isomerase, FKBP-type family protein [Brugia malayi]